MFVDDLELPALADDDRHHLERALRMRAGDALTVADGNGRWRTAVLGADVAPTGPIEDAAAALPSLTIGFALVKGDKPELIVQKLTELGVDRIVPFRAERSVVQWDEAKAAKAVVRLRAVARSSAMQCHRPRLPVIEALSDLRSLAQLPGAAIAQRGGLPPSLDHPVVLVGPEGGWAPGEEALALPRVALGSHVLRAETAVLAAGVLMTALRAELLGSKD